MAAAVLALTTNGVRRGLRSRSLLLMGVVGPLLLGTVLALALGGDGPSLRIALVDEDRTEVSAAVLDGVAEGLAGSQVEVTRPAGSEQVDADLDEGRVDAAIVLEPGWSASQLSGSPAAVVVLGDPERPLGADVAGAIAAEIATGADQQRALVESFAAEGLDPAAALAVDDPGGLVVVQRPVDGDVGATLYFGPLAVFLFLGLAGTARGLLRDERAGVVARIRAASVSTSEIVAGTAGTVVVQGLVASAAVVAVSWLVFGAAWGAPLEVLVVVVAFVVSVAGLLGVVVGAARTELQAESWANVLAFSFAILGGSFFGGALLPGVLGTVGLLTPNGAAMRALIELGPGGRSLGEVWYLIAWMLVVGAVGTLVGGAMLRRRWSS